jgi:hypothetical protein
MKYWNWIGVIIPIIIVLSIFGGGMKGSVEGFGTDPIFSDVAGEGDMTPKPVMEIDSNNLPTKQNGASYTDGGDVSDYNPRWTPARESSVDRQQDKHIEDLRLVLKNTIQQLRKDDILPAGSPCNCDEKPMVDPFTGNAEPVNGCRPPGWLRMMEQKNTNTHTNPVCGVTKKTPLAPFE